MDRKIIGLIAVFFIMFAFFAGNVALEGPLSQLTRAKEETVPDPIQTRILAWPLYKVPADGKHTSAITVIVRNNKTKPIEGRLVTLTSTVGNFSQSTASTNKQGMAVFNLTSTTPGVATINATIDNSIQVPQSVTIEFVE